MAAQAKALVIEVPDISEALLQRIDERVALGQYSGRGEFVRELLDRELANGSNTVAMERSAHRASEQVRAVVAEIEASGLPSIPGIPDEDFPRDLIHRDIALKVTSIEDAFARIEARNRVPRPLIAPGADSRDAIYGERG